MTKYTWRVTTSPTILWPFSCSSHCSGNSAWRPARDNKWVGGPSVLDKGVCLTVQFFTVACAFWILSRGSGSMQYLWKNDGKSPNFLPSVRGALWFPHIGYPWKNDGKSPFFLMHVGVSGSLTPCWYNAFCPVGAFPEKHLQKPWKKRFKQLFDWTKAPLSGLYFIFRLGWWKATSHSLAQSRQQYHRTSIQSIYMAKKGKKKARSRKMKLGQAAVLSGKMWSNWRNHILKNSSTWLYVAVTLTHALCARITEVLKLKASDFHWTGRTVTIAALKRQPQAG